jgi:hypothetical protein
MPSIVGGTGIGGIRNDRAVADTGRPQEGNVFKMIIRRSGRAIGKLPEVRPSYLPSSLPEVVTRRCCYLARIQEQT